MTLDQLMKSNSEWSSGTLLDLVMLGDGTVLNEIGIKTARVLYGKETVLIYSGRLVVIAV